MSSPTVTPDATQGSLSLSQLAQQVKGRNPGLSDMEDADVAVLYLQKFPDQAKLLSSDHQKLAANLLNDTTGDGIRNFYKTFGQQVLQDSSFTNLPDFLRDRLSGSKVQVSLGDPARSTVAHVYPGQSKIYVDRPGLMDRPTFGHEATHVYQGQLQEPMKGDANPNNPDYDYGGWQGLIKAQAQRKTIRDFTDEQQAEMVGDYLRLQDEMLDPSYMKKTPEQRIQLLKEWDLANKALAPYLRQLAGQPKQGDNGKGGIDTRPPAPPSAPAELTGMAIPLKEIGGKAAFLSGLVPKQLSKGRGKP